MDSYLNILSLALAIAALIPVLLPNGRRTRFWTITAGALALIMLLVAYEMYQEYSEQKMVREVKEEIRGLLAKHKKGLTFEQIYDNLYYPGFNVTNIAIDSLVKERQVLNDKMDTVDKDGNKYVIRRYYREFGD